MTPSKGTRYYGGNGTIHGTTELDVETKDGKVVAVWFRCCALPFRQSEADQSRADEMKRMYQEGSVPKMDGVTVFE